METILKKHDLDGIEAIYSDREIATFIEDGKIRSHDFYDFLIKNQRIAKSTNLGKFIEALATYAFSNVTLNTGSVVDPNKIILREQAAHNFAEGNKELEELLLYAWGHNLETYSCCAGHEYQDGSHNISKPRVVFKTTEKILQIIDILKEKGYDIVYISNERKSGIAFYDNNFDLMKETTLFKDVFLTLKRFEHETPQINGELARLIMFLENILIRMRSKKTNQDELRIMLFQGNGKVRYEIWPCDFMRFISSINYDQDGLIQIEESLLKESDEKLKKLRNKIQEAILNQKPINSKTSLVIRNLQGLKNEISMRGKRFK